MLSESLALEPGRGALDELTALPAGTRTPDWLAGWRAADERAAGGDPRACSAHEELSEPAIAAELGVLLPADGNAVRRLLDAGARDRDVLARAREIHRACCATAARTESTGSSRARSAPPPSADGPVVLLIGDVALAHDIGGLLAARRLESEADDRAGRQRRRRDLRLPAGLATRDGQAQSGRTSTPATSPLPPGLRLRAGRRAVRPGSRARGDRPRLPRGPGASTLAAGRLSNRAGADRPRKQRRVARSRVERRVRTREAATAASAAAPARRGAHTMTSSAANLSRRAAATAPEA